MSIRVGEQEFPIQSAQLTYTRVPNGTITVSLEISGEREHGLDLTLDPPPLSGRELADLTGQVQILPSPTAPDRHDPGAVVGVAGIYSGTNGDVVVSRGEWGRVDERGISVHWTGLVRDLDYYCSDPQYALVVDAHVPVTERAHAYVSWYLICAGRDEFPRIEALKDRVVQDLAESLTARRWFDGMPFAAVEIAVQVEAKGRAWPPLPPTPANEAPIIVAKLLRGLVMSGDEDSLRRALDAEISAGLEQLDKRYRQDAPRFL